jgi:hypothetical protein
MKAEFIGVMTKSGHSTRFDRAAAALRENLKRRKAQSRARSVDTASGKNAASDAEKDALAAFDGRQSG